MMFILSRAGSRWPLTVVSLTLGLVALMSGCTSEKNRLDAEARRLCAIDGGLTVYETATLPPDKFNKYGQAEIPHKVDERGFGYFYRSKQDHLAGQISQLAGEGPGLKRFTTQLVRTSDNKVMGELRYYGRHGGNFLDGFVQGRGFQCPDVDPRELERSVILKGGQK